MNIAFISPPFYPCKVGGAEIFNYYFTKELSKNHCVKLFTICDTVDKNMHWVKLKPIKPRKLSIPFQIFLKLIKYKKEIDLIVIPYMRLNWYYYFVFVIINSLFNLPYVLMIHGGSFHEWKPFRPYKMLFKRAAEITAVSQRAVDEYEKRSKKHVHLIPPLIPYVKSTKSKETILDQFNIPVNSKIILYIGSLKPIKSPETLLESIIKLPQEYIVANQLYVIFTGTGSLLENLKNLVAKNNLSNHIKFTGIIDRERIPDLYKIADIYVITSEFENTPLSLLEAMYNAKTILASDSPGINNIIKNKENGFLFPYKDSSKLTGLIKDIISNQNLYKNLGLKASEDFKNRFDYLKMLENSEQIFKKTISTKEKNKC